MRFCRVRQRFLSLPLAVDAMMRFVSTTDMNAPLNAVLAGEARPGRGQRYVAITTPSSPLSLLRLGADIGDLVGPEMAPGRVLRLLLQEMRAHADAARRQQEQARRPPVEAEVESDRRPD